MCSRLLQFDTYYNEKKLDFIPQILVNFCEPNNDKIHRSHGSSISSSMFLNTRSQEVISHLSVALLLLTIIKKE